MRNKDSAIGTMSSRKSSELLDLEHDLPTSREDLDALARIRDLRRVDFPTYLKFLGAVAPPPSSLLRLRRGPSGEPFEL